MAVRTITDEFGRKKKIHVCDDKCQRNCDRCTGRFIVHGMHRWAVQAVAGQTAIVQYGVGGLLCDDCALIICEDLHNPIRHG